MQVRYNDHNQPVANKHRDLVDQSWKLFRLMVPYNRTQLKAITYDPNYNPGTVADIKGFQKLVKEFLEDPEVLVSKGEYMRPTLRSELVDMKGEPIRLGSLFIQNHNRKLSVYIVTSVGKTGGAGVNRLEDSGGCWTPYKHSCLLTLPKPEYYLIVEPSFLSDEQKECLEKVFERYPLCKLGYDEVYGRNR